MKKITWIQIIKYLKIVTILLIVLSMLPWESWFSFEIRTEELAYFFCGRFTTDLISLLLLLFLIRTILNWKPWESFIYLIPIGFFFYFDIFLGMFAGSEIWEDFSYYSSTQNEKVLVIQRYSFGINGNNPKYRGILSNKKSLLNTLRFITIVDDSVIPKYLIEKPWPYKTEKLPHNLTYLRDTFYKMPNPLPKDTKLQK